jgi:hypothetical protein
MNSSKGDPMQRIQLEGIIPPIPPPFVDDRVEKMWSNGPAQAYPGYWHWDPTVNMSI